MGMVAPTGSSGKSAAVTTASTPCSACGARRCRCGGCGRARAGCAAAWRAPCRAARGRRDRRASPVTRSRASTRGSRLPMTFERRRRAGVDRAIGSLASLRRGGGRDGLDDLAVAGAAAQVAGDGVADLVRRSGCGLRIEQRLGGRARCRACRSRIACRRARPAPAGSDAARRPSDRPSMVMMSRPGASSASTRQALTGAPSISTVQVPQLPLPQPSLVPVRPRRSRSRSSSVSRVSASTVCSSPLTVQVRSVFMRRDPDAELRAAIGERARRQHGHQRSGGSRPSRACRRSGARRCAAQPAGLLEQRVRSAARP